MAEAHYRIEQLPRGKIPKPNAIVLSTSGQGVAIGTEGAAGDPAVVAKLTYFLSCGRVPDVSHPLLAKGQNALAVLAKDE